MTAAAVQSPLPSPDPAVADVEIVVPVHNEQDQLAGSVHHLVARLAGLPVTWRVTIADNASTDATPVIAARLAASVPGVAWTRLEEKGRGRALKRAWGESRSPVLAYMDVDLSTDLDALLPLVAPLLTGHSDVAIGSRLSRGSRVVRGPRREVVSRCYNLLLRGTLRAGFRDAQCGFKAVRRDVARELLPLVQDDGWFFDTELLVLAERAGLRIHEVPVDWVDDPDSSVDVVRTAWADLRGMARLGRALATGRLPLDEVSRALAPARARAAAGRLAPQAALFVLVGVVSTAVYSLLYLALHTTLAPVAANAVALLVSAVANTAANRRLTFGVRGPGGAVRHHAQGLAVFAVGLALTTATVTLTAHTGSRVIEVAALTAANLTVTLGRFAAMRWWMFASSHGSVDGSSPRGAGGLATRATGHAESNQSKGDTPWASSSG